MSYCAVGRDGRYNDWLRAGRSEDRIPTGTGFSAPVRTASYSMGTGSLSRGVKRPCRVVDHPSLSSAEVKERVELNIYSPSGPSWSVLG